MAFVEISWVGLVFALGEIVGQKKVLSSERICGRGMEGISSVAVALRAMFSAGQCLLSPCVFVTVKLLLVRAAK